MSSPLNPNRRKVGKPSKLNLQLGDTPTTAAHKALEQSHRDGVVEFEFNGRKITVDDTDTIAAVVARVERELGL